MSTTVMAACWPLQMPPTPKAVLMSLADNANDHGDCWPSISYISMRTCFGKTAVIEAIQWLEQAGHLTADRSNGRHTTYRVLPNLDLFSQPTKPARLADRYAKRSGLPSEHNQSATRTAPVRQADTNRQEPSVTIKSVALAPVQEIQKPTAAGQICKALIAAGIVHVSPTHPKLLILIAAGADDPAEYADVAREAVAKGKGTFPWVLAAVEGRRREAAETGAIPKPAAAKPREFFKAQGPRAGPKVDPARFRDIVQAREPEPT